MMGAVWSQSDLYVPSIPLTADLQTCKRDASTRNIYDRLSTELSGSALYLATGGNIASRFPLEVDVIYFVMSSIT